MAKVAEKAEWIEDIHLLDAVAGRANMLRSCELSLKCVASGIRCWGHFREMRGRELSPPQEEAALAG